MPGANATPARSKGALAARRNGLATSGVVVKDKAATLLTTARPIALATTATPEAAAVGVRKAAPPATHGAVGTRKYPSSTKISRVSTLLASHNTLENTCLICPA